jgi:hypothetical protein
MGRAGAAPVKRAVKPAPIEFYAVAAPVRVVAGLDPAIQSRANAAKQCSAAGGMSADDAQGSLGRNFSAEAA